MTHYTSPTANKKMAILDTLKEELFSLESEKLSGRLSPEEYAEASAALDARLKQAQEPPISNITPPEPAELEQEQAYKEPSRNSLWISAPVLAVLSLTVFLLYHRYPLSAETAGYLVGSLLVPFLIAYAIAGAKRRRNWVLFWCLFIGIAIVLSSATNQKSLIKKGDPPALPGWQ